MGRLAGKLALVTGAASGIGRATVERFAVEGAVVGLVDLDGDAVQRVGAGIRASGGQAYDLTADVTVEEQVDRAVSAFAAAAGGLNVAVVNAGIQLFGQDNRAHELDAEVWRRTIETNLTGAFLTCKHAIAAMLGSGGGSIIFTGSPTGLYGGASGFDAYSASKAGVHGLMRVLANDYARDGIRVNAVVPGFTRTPLVHDVDASMHEELIRSIPLGRQGTADEVAAMMTFLASDEASYSTGAFFFADGGATSV